MQQNSVDETLTPITKVLKSMQVGQSTTSILRYQFPVLPAEAITIYKSQGSTFDTIVVR